MQLEVENKAEIMFEGKMADNFPKIKSSNHRSKKLRESYRININSKQTNKDNKEHIPGHFTVKLLKIKVKEKI